MPPILAKVGQQVEVFIAPCNFEGDAGGAVAFDQQLTIAEHPVNEVCRGSARVYQVAAASASSLDRISKLVKWSTQAMIARFGKQDGDVEIAFLGSSPTGETSEQVGDKHARITRERFARSFNHIN